MAISLCYKVWFSEYKCLKKKRESLFSHKYNMSYTFWGWELDMANPEDMIKQCIMTLHAMSDDPTIPRNIRRMADNTMKVLMDEKKTIGLRAATALSMIDEVSNDSNLPIHARTKIWELASNLEAVPFD
jgi:hypothetical protein